MSKPLTDESGEVRELTAADFKKMRPISEVNPVLFEKLKQGQRGLQKTPTKEPVSIRLSPEVTTYFKETGKGWQSRLNDVLIDYVKSQEA